MKTKKTIILTTILVLLQLQFFGLASSQKYVFYERIKFSSIGDISPQVFVDDQNLSIWHGMFTLNPSFFEDFPSLNPVQADHISSTFLDSGGFVIERWSYFETPSTFVVANDFLADIIAPGDIADQVWAAMLHSFSYDFLRFLRPEDLGEFDHLVAGIRTINSPSFEVFLSTCPNHNATIKSLGVYNTFRKNDTVVLEVDGNFPDYHEMDFVWEYSLDGMNFQRQEGNDFFGRTLKITLADIPEAEPNQNIYFRLKHCGDFYRPNHTAGSVPEVFLFLPELPEFSDALFEAKINCPNEIPQSLFLPFDRNLDENEKITTVYLFQTIVNGRPVDRVDVKFSTSTNGITIEFDDVLSNGDYFLMMEGSNSGIILSAKSTTVRIKNPEFLDFEFVVSPSSGTEYHEGIPSIVADGKIEVLVKNYADDFYVFFEGKEVEHNNPKKIFSSLAPGTYSTQIFYNSNQCVTVVSTTVKKSDNLLNARIEIGMPISCAGRSDASLQTVVETTTTKSEVSFSWYKNEIAMPNKILPFLENLSIGNYKVVAEIGGLRSTYSFFVDEPAPLVSTVKSIGHPFCGNSDGHIHIAATGGTQPYSFTWNTGQKSDFINQLSGGIYDYIIHDTHGCEVSGEIDLISPKPLEITVVEKIEQLYFGSELGVVTPSKNSGLIRVSAEFGTPPYHFQWSNGATDSVLKDLSFGVFHLTVIDYYSCEQFLTVELPQRFPLTATVQKITYINCFESDDAILQAHIEGGIPPYTYRWIHTDDTALQQVGLGVGTYEFEVIDSRGIRSFDRIYISQPNPLRIVLSANSVSGWGASDGSIHAVASGGTPPYTVEWRCSTTTSVADLTTLNSHFVHRLQAGMYHLRITDANGCWLKDSIVVGSPDSLTLVGQIYHCSYFGSIQGVLPIEPNNGRINTQVEGGVKPYIYQWFYQMPNNEWAELLSKNLPYIDSLTGGRYALLVTDANGYTISDTFEVVKTKPLMVSISATSPLCFGRFDGKLEALVTGGTPPYFYRWNLGDTSSFLQNLTVGHYSVVVQDSLGILSTFELTLTQPEPLSMDYITNPITQQGGNSGAIFTAIQGGILPYSYLWTNPDTIGREPQISNLRAGVYVLQVTDANGCLLSTSFAKNDPDALEITARIKPISYLGSVQGRFPDQSADGEIYLTVSGGFPPYEFLWSNNETTPYLANLSEGSYAVIVADKYGNEAFGVFEIKSTESLMLTVNQDILIACYGDSSAQLTAHVFGGTPPYTYRWSTGATQHIVGSLPAGKYHLEVTDSLGVTANFTIHVDEPMPLMVAASVTQPQCPNPDNGSIRLFVSGGIPSYQYIWNTGEQTAQRQRLSDGVYEVAVFDANGCSQNHTFVLQTPLTAHIQQHDFIRCFGDSNVTLELIICGGVPPYEILWNTGDSALFLYDRNSGLYSAIVTDNVGNVYTTSIEIFEPLPLSVTGSFAHPSCFGENDGSIRIFVDGGVRPYLYRWSNMTTSPQLTNLSGGYYSVFVTDRNGCQTTYSATLVEPEKLFVNLGLDRTLCQGQTLSIVLPNDNLAYFWQKNGSFWHVGNSVEIFEAGEYTVIAEDETGCKTFDTLHIKIVSNFLVAEFWHSHEAVVGEDFVVANIGQTPFDYLTWNVTPNAQVVSQNNDYFVLRFSDTGEYQISLTVYKNDCFEEQVGIVNVIFQQENLQMRSTRTRTLSNLKLFPNPARDLFNFSVKAPKSTTLHWTLTNASTGSVVIFGQTQTDLNGLATQQISLPRQLRGIYVFRVFTEKEQVSEQLIIQ